MTDEELIEKCAIAIGWQHLGAVGVQLSENERHSPSEVDAKYPKQLWCLSGGNDWWKDPEGNSVCGRCENIPDPLHDGANAFALLKMFPVHCIDALDNLIPHGPEKDEDYRGLDFNRVICEAVAMIEISK